MQHHKNKLSFWNPWFKEGSKHIYINKSILHLRNPSVYLQLKHGEISNYSCPTYIRFLASVHS